MLKIIVLFMLRKAISIKCKYSLSYQSAAQWSTVCALFTSFLTAVYDDTVFEPCDTLETKNTHNMCLFVSHCLIMT